MFEQFRAVGHETGTTEPGGTEMNGDKLIELVSELNRGTRISISGLEGYSH